MTTTIRPLLQVERRPRLEVGDVCIDKDNDEAVEVLEVKAIGWARCLTKSGKMHWIHVEDLELVTPIECVKPEAR